MQATLTELARDTRKIVRPVIHSGKEVILTDRGRPVAKIIQYIPTRRFDDPIQARRGTVSDESILESIRDDREGYAERGACSPIFSSRNSRALKPSMHWKPEPKSRT